MWAGQQGRALHRYITSTAIISTSALIRGDSLCLYTRPCVGTASHDPTTPLAQGRLTRRAQNFSRLLPFFLTSLPHWRNRSLLRGRSPVKPVMTGSTDGAHGAHSSQQSAGHSLAAR